MPSAQRLTPQPAICKDLSRRVSRLKTSRNTVPHSPRSDSDMERESYEGTVAAWVEGLAEGLTTGASLREASEYCAVSEGCAW